MKGPTKFVQNLSIPPFPSNSFKSTLHKCGLFAGTPCAAPKWAIAGIISTNAKGMARAAVPVVEGKGRAQRNTCGSSAPDAQRALQQALKQASTHAAPASSAWRATVGWLLLLLVVACAGAAPKHLSDLYLALAVVGLPWRVYSFGRKGWAFFLLDYCYVSSLEASACHSTAHHRLKACWNPSIM